MLQRIATIPTIGVLGTCYSTISQARGDNEYIGIAYNPVTGGKISDISANISRNPNEIQGNMKFSEDIGISSYPLNIPLPINAIPIEKTTAPKQSTLPTSSVVSDFVQYHWDEFEKNGIPIKSRITSVESGDISGMIRRPNDPESKVAFRMGPNNGDTRSRIEDTVLFNAEVTK